MTRNPAALKVQRALTRFDQLKKRKAPWNPHWQIVGEYVHGRKQNFTAEVTAGDFLNRDLFDNQGAKSNNTMASALLGMLWPNGAKSFRLLPPRGLREDAEIKKYYETASEIMAEEMDEPAAGLATALDEYMKDEGSFGTAGVSAEPGKETALSFKSWGVKEIFIAEGRNGFIDTVYIFLEWTVREVVAEYGLERVSEKTRKQFDEGQYDEKVKILVAMEPRLEAITDPGGNLDMPIESLHIEIDQKHLIRESGYEELPIKVSRFWKLAGEEYGRSPGMEALPDILELNAIWESVTIAIEKMLDPPMGILDDGRLGGGTIDTSAGAINVFNITGRAGERAPVFPLQTVGELQHVVQLIEKLNESIANHFFIDRLLDLNNETEMTAYETSIRNRLRGATLGLLFARQIAEFFNPLIQRCFNILFAQGKLGVVAGSPEEKVAREIFDEDPLIIPTAVAELMAAGKEAYRIKYVTPAARIMDSEEAQGLIETWNMAATIGQGRPEVYDNLDPDFSIKHFGRVSGAPGGTFVDEKTVKTIRDARAAAARQAMELQAAREGAAAAKDASAAGLLEQPGAGGRTGGRVNPAPEAAAA